MVNQEKINQAKSLQELLQAYFPIEQYEWTKKIVLDAEFLNQAKKWPDDTLDFGSYKDLEIITISSQTTNKIFKTVEYAKGEIRKINVSKNKNLKELIMPNQELERTLDLSANLKLEKLNIAYNLLNELRVHSNFSQKLREIDSKYLQPQKHNKDKIHPIKDVTNILLDMSELQKSKQNEYQKSTRDLYEEKSEELSQLKISLESKLESDWQLSYLETLLISQGQIIRDQNIVSSSERELEKAKKKLREKLSEEEIENICQIKVELTKLEIDLENLQIVEKEAKVEVFPK